VLASLFFDRPQAPAPRWVRVATVLLLSALLAAMCWALLAASTSNWSSIWNYRDVFWQGWWLTIRISLVALGLSTAAGILLALARRSPFLPLRSLALIYIEIIRGSPLLVQILFIWSAVGLVHIDNRLVVGTLILSGFSSAYLAEMIRAGIESVGASQLESARAIGLSPLQTYRFVIFPQAIRQILPSLAGQFASLIKDSSLLSIIGLSEFTLAAQQVNSATYSTLESYVPLAIGYLLLTLPISALSRLLERRFHYES
jgi:polar amino acid transport system permease protein